MISVRFQGKPFNITVIQVYAPTSNAEEGEVERFALETNKRSISHYILYILHYILYQLKHFAAFVFSPVSLSLFISLSVQFSC